MANDLEIIKRLEKIIGKKFTKAGIDEIKRYKRPGYYAVNAENRVIGLNLADTNLTEVPGELLELSDLVSLNLGYNKISDIAFLKDLANLTTLYLNDNQIKQLPRWVVNWDMEINWDKYSGIVLKGNPLENPPVEIVKEGKQAVIKYFNSLEGEKKALNEIKVLLVGDGGAGKTSLMKRLFKDSFKENEPQTHGIAIRDKKIKTAAKTILTHFWDFGGQEIMHATDQFFLSKRGLYILVLDGRKEEDPEYWLKHIETFGGNSPLLVVINKIVQNPGFDVNRKFLQD
ncbi:MAG: hypothetical protein GY757_22820, partial [bacterium]|nr:hypothetical protein [bacterium]